MDHLSHPRFSDPVDPAVARASPPLDPSLARTVLDYVNSEPRMEPFLLDWVQMFTDGDWASQAEAVEVNEGYLLLRTKKPVNEWNEPAAEGEGVGEVAVPFPRPVKSLADARRSLKELMDMASSRPQPQGFLVSQKRDSR